MAKNTMLRKLGAKKKIIKKVIKKPILEIKLEEPEVEKEKIVYPQHNGMNLLEGDDALLLAEACKLDKTKKVAEKRLKVIKIALGLDTKGEYTNKAGDLVTVSVSPKKSDVDPMELQKKLKEQKKESKFWSCVKVQLTPLKKVLVQDEIDKMQFDLDDIIKCSFK